MHTSDITTALEQLCSLLASQSQAQDDLITETFPFEDGRFTVPDGALSAHAMLEMHKRCTALGEAIRKVPRFDLIEPVFRFHTYGSDYSELSILLGKDFVWDCSFSGAADLITQLVNEMAEISDKYPTGPVQTYVVEGDGSGIFADGRIYDVSGSSEDEIVALFSMMRSKVGHGTDTKDIIRISIKQAGPHKVRV